MCLCVLNTIKLYWNGSWNSSPPVYIPFVVVDPFGYTDRPQAHRHTDRLSYCSKFALIFCYPFCRSFEIVSSEGYKIPYSRGYFVPTLPLAASSQLAGFSIPFASATRASPSPASAGYKKAFPDRLSWSSIHVCVCVCVYPSAENHPEGGTRHGGKGPGWKIILTLVSFAASDTRRFKVLLDRSCLVGCRRCIDSRAWTFFFILFQFQFQLLDSFNGKQCSSWQKRKSSSSFTRAIEWLKAWKNHVLTKCN